MCSPPRPLVRVPVGAPASSHQDSLTIPRSCSPAAPRMRLPDVSALRRGSRAALPRRQSTVARLDIRASNFHQPRLTVPTRAECGVTLDNQYSIGATAL